MASNLFSFVSVSIPPNMQDVVKASRDEAAATVRMKEDLQSLFLGLHPVLLLSCLCLCLDSLFG